MSLQMIGAKSCWLSKAARTGWPLSILPMPKADFCILALWLRSVLAIKLYAR